MEFMKRRIDAEFAGSFGIPGVIAGVLELKIVVR